MENKFAKYVALYKKLDRNAPDNRTHADGAFYMGTLNINDSLPEVSDFFRMYTAEPHFPELAYCLNNDDGGPDYSRVMIPCSHGVVGRCAACFDGGGE